MITDPGNVMSATANRLQLERMDIQAMNWGAAWRGFINAYLWMVAYICLSSGETQSASLYDGSDVHVDQLKTGARRIYTNTGYK